MKIFRNILPGGYLLKHPVYVTVNLRKFLVISRNYGYLSTVITRNN